MSTTDIDTTKVTTQTGLSFGRDDASIKLIEFVNLRCPFCRQWWDEKIELIRPYVESGKVQHIVKLFDKQKPGLAKGNVMHHYVPNNEGAIEVISAIYDTQDEWGDLDTPDEIAHFAEHKLGLVLQDYQVASQDIVAEANDANIVFVPTMIVNDIYFDQKISNSELKTLLDA
ncbi:MAG: thioredoxin domain-containing protein [Vagococcus sp.]